jgi:hypothetical protein
MCKWWDAGQQIACVLCPTPRDRKLALTSCPNRFVRTVFRRGCSDDDRSWFSNYTKSTALAGARELNYTSEAVKVTNTFP